MTAARAGWLGCLGFAGWLAAAPALASAAGDFHGKRTLRIEGVAHAQIELPDESTYAFGEDYESLLRERLLKSGRYLVNTAWKDARSAASAPGFEWFASITPAATVRVEIEALSFTSGAKGNRVFYGFDERLRTSFNDGSPGQLNEFPLKKVQFDPNWFDRTFDRKGNALDHSQIGLDLGDGIRLNSLFGWLDLKYLRYHARMKLRLHLDAPLAGRHEERVVDVQGQGFYYDFAGAYGAFSAGIRVARRDAMLQALKRALEGSVDAIDRALQDLPVTARIDALREVDGERWILLGTGRGAGVPVGTRFEVPSVPGAVLEVALETGSGTVAKLVTGDVATLGVGLEVRSVEPAPVARLAGNSGATLESVVLPERNLPKPVIPADVAQPRSFWSAVLQMLGDWASLPARLLRYSQYDQTYHAESDGPAWDGPADWQQQVRSQDWAARIGLTGLPEPGTEAESGGAGPVVAVIDTGIDYNHPVLHEALALNASPVDPGDGHQDRYGWDFISGDSRPYDDAYHGTQVASLILAVAPRARLLPLKVFNPSGVTSGAALHGAFQYALDHGARILVCAWATRKATRALAAAVRLAEARGALVVAAAGDRGDELSQGSSGESGLQAFPASEAATSASVLAVAGVDGHGRLVQKRGRYSNFGESTVQIAAPGQDLVVAEPRAHLSRDTGTGLAAALVAGAAARIQDSESRQGRALSGPELKARVLEQAVRLPALEGKVEGARFLRIPR